KKDLVAADQLIIGNDDLYVSAFDQDDLEKIKRKIEHVLKSTMEDYELLIPSEHADFIAKCRQIGIIESLHWNDEQNVYQMKVYLPYYHDLRKSIEGFLEIKHK